MRSKAASVAEPPVRFASRIDRPGGAPGVLERGGWLTGYVAQDVAEDALHAGAGARLELRVPDAAVHLVDDRFGWLRRHGIELSVHRAGAPSDPDPGAA